MKHAVIFDIDGTLLNSAAEDDRIYRKAVIDVLGDVQLRAELTDYERVTDTGILLQVLADNHISADPETVDRVKQTFFSNLQTYVDSVGSFVEIPGARSILQRIAAAEDYSLAIATGGWRRSAEIKLKSAGFDIGSAPLATSDDAIERIEIMQKALVALDDEFVTVTYFGDGVWDRQACSTLGWTFSPVGPGVDGIVSYDGLYEL